MQIEEVAKPFEAPVKLCEKTPVMDGSEPAPVLLRPGQKI